MKPGMICVVCVDDTIFATTNSADLEREIVAVSNSTNEHCHTFQLCDKDVVGAFLGFQMEKVVQTNSC